MTGRPAVAWPAPRPLPRSLRIVPFTMHHLDHFLPLAAAEGWLCGRWEFEFLLSAFPQGCMVACDGDAPIGYVTAIGYGGSGWIGNLLVHPGMRGAGVGTSLMARAILVLEESGADTLWLTASHAGRPIYETLGFRAIDGIVRWRGRGRGGGPPDAGMVAVEEMLRYDRAGWGDGRDALVRAVAARGAVCGDPGGFLIVQATEELVQVGPWGCSTASAAARLFRRALHGAGSHPVVLDSPEGNGAAVTLLEKQGFVAVGTTALMFRGRLPAYRPERVFALATLGSIG